MLKIPNARCVDFFGTSTSFQSYNLPVLFGSGHQEMFSPKKLGSFNIFHSQKVQGFTQTQYKYVIYINMLYINMLLYCFLRCHFMFSFFQCSVFSSCFFLFFLKQVSNRCSNYLMAPFFYV